MTDEHWHLTDDLTEFLTTAGPFLRSRPAQHTVPLTVTENLRTQGTGLYGDGQPLFGTLTDADGQVVAALFHTPPFPLNVTRLTPRRTESLVEALLTHRHPLAGITSEADTAEAFVAAWRRETNATATVSRRERLYRLEELTTPSPAPPGRPRTASPADHAQLRVWNDDFAKDVGVPHSIADSLLTARIAAGSFTLWETPDGTPVSMVSATDPIANQIRIVTVYTPPEHRAKGYAGAATAEASRRARETGVQEVLLFTDLANPTSNALYQRIGYRPVADFTVYGFEGGPSD
ncbi:GNAT family N-acetyltransferase [Streptomyces roseirectus]|uniref:GNAT family N-acetyltransferase n=1 Tax=Streptomyces roseirectus TaxID=2768066 RepID=A0A7H0IGZ1_9ACTN|nr:GNAT family N-acetyltransferase [Streptomyces roseirectus]QNP72057.1 GNAT family N-acetyltransferase [Streptomyces roseirectus]